MTRKFNSNDRSELINKISKSLSVNLRKLNNRYQKLYIDEFGNTYCIFNGGLWHSIYETMFRELSSHQDKDMFIILGTLDERSNKVKVFKGALHKKLIPELDAAPEGGKQYYLNFRISGDEATIEQQPEQRLVKIFEYEPSGSFIDNEDSKDLEGNTGISNITAKTESQSFNYKKEIINLDNQPVSEINANQIACKYGLVDAEKELFCAKEEISEIISIIKRKKNIILQGPPGVGKTFMAIRLAALMVGQKNSNQVSMIQFHQSYCYEEFIRGWKPKTDGSFDIKDGVFLRFCERAKKFPEKPFVFMIDEINRGNLSRIFGEAMLLIEADKRSVEYAVDLSHQKEGESKFFIPSNVYLIGMMNTADRSLAMVDYALRRRFVFIDVKPAFENDKFKASLQNNGVSAKILNTVVHRISKINKEIVADMNSLGEGYQIGHSFFCSEAGSIVDENWYRQIVRYELMPLLKEYWFDKPDNVKQTIDFLLQDL